MGVLVAADENALGASSTAELRVLWGKENPDERFI
jgi:hypothetical protein